MIGVAAGSRQRLRRTPPATAAWRCSSAGQLAVLVALVSPIDVLGDQLLVMHMVQHLLLIDIAPILCILGFNKVLLRPVTRRLHVVERRAGYLAHPAFAVLAYAGFMWLWHIPAMYDAALHNTDRPRVRAPVLRRRRLAVLVAPALADPQPHADGRPGPGRLHGRRPSCWWARWGSCWRSRPASFYPFYEHHPHYWGLSPSEDQSMAGLVMALEQSIVMGIALVWVFVRMLSESEREAQRAERYEVA